MNYLKDGEEIHVLNSAGLKIIQKQSGFRFGTDAVLLSDFALIKRGASTIDFGTGTGIIALLAYSRHKDIRLKGLEIQPEMADMAQRSVELNELSNKIEIVHGDIRDAHAIFGYGSFDHVLCNPPYHDAARGFEPQDENKLISKTQAQITLAEIFQSAFRVLKSGSRLSMVYPAGQFEEVIIAMREFSLAPKRLRTVHATINHAPKLILIDAVKQGGSGIQWLPPLILKNEDGSPTEEWKRIYG